MERKDCFAWKKSGNCKALTEMVCKNEECKFYKPKEIKKEEN